MIMPIACTCESRLFFSDPVHARLTLVYAALRYNSGKAWVDVWAQRVLVGPRGRLDVFRRLHEPVREGVIRTALSGFRKYNRYTLSQLIELNKVVAAHSKL